MISRNQPHPAASRIPPGSLRCALSGAGLAILTSLVLLIPVVLVLSCVKQGPIPTIQDLQGRAYSDNEIRDISLTIILLDPVERRELLTSEDPIVWVAEYWVRNDPSPGTPGNETLEVLRQRAGYLQERFPDTFLNEIPEPWLSFLKYGLWDWVHSGTLPTAPQPVDRVRFAGIADVLLYDALEPYEVILPGDWIGRRDRRRPKTPPLTQVWDILENPESRRVQKVDALRRIAWFETLTIAQRILDIPDSTLDDVSSEREECFRRMAVRRSYCLGKEGARRLAAIASVGAPPRMQLSRAVENEYSSDQFIADLTALLKIREDVDNPMQRGTHPSLRTKPEEFLKELAERFPASKSVTGWDWRGDLYLVFGPPQQLNVQRHIARYAYGYPAVYRINAGMLGAVDAVRLEDWAQMYTGSHYMNVGARRAQAQITISELMAVIPEATTATATLLSHLHRLLPPKTQPVGLISAENALEISADAVVFPDSSNSVDIMASMGIPFAELSMTQLESGLHTSLETCCILLRAPLHPVWSERHNEGFHVEMPEGSIKNLYLVDAFRCRIEPEDYILYCSALDPYTERSGGVLVYLDLQSEETSGPVLSPIALTNEVSDEAAGGDFERGGYQIVPYPGRNLIYGEDIWLYFEIRNLEKSDYGDFAWEESYYFIPDRTDMGIVRISPGMIHNSINPRVNRSFMIDLSSMEQEYTGPLFILILVTDVVSGQHALTAARFSMGPG